MRNALAFAVVAITLAAVGMGLTFAATSVFPPAEPTLEQAIEDAGLEVVTPEASAYYYVVTEGPLTGAAGDAVVALAAPPGELPPGRFVQESCTTYSDSPEQPGLGSENVTRCTLVEVSRDAVVKFAQGQPKGGPSA